MHLIALGILGLLVFAVVSFIVLIKSKRFRNFVVFLFEIEDKDVKEETAKELMDKHWEIETKARNKIHETVTDIHQKEEECEKLKTVFTNLDENK